MQRFRFRMSRRAGTVGVAVLAALAAGCAPAYAPVGDNPYAGVADPGETLVFSYPGDLPEWVYAPGTKDDDDARHFAGISRKFTEEVDARRDALANAREQIASFLRSDVKRMIRQVSAFTAAGSDIIDPGTVSDEATSIATDATLLGTNAGTFYAEKWERKTADATEHYWKVYVLVPLYRKAEYDLAVGVLKAHMASTKDEDTRTSMQRAIDKLHELEAKGWFAK